MAWSSSPRTLPSIADVVVIGDVDHAQGVCDSLRRISTSVHHVPTLARALERGLGRAMAHVLVSPLPEAELAAAIVQLRICGPVFVVVPEDFSDARARSLYEKGSHVVFEWPAEAQLMPRMVQERLELTPRPTGPVRDADLALSRSIRTRLDLARPSFTEIAADVDDGVVRLHGSTDSVWKKHQLEAMVVHVPGVRAVLGEEVEVIPPERADALIDRDLRGVIDIVLGSGARTVSFSVQDAAVVLVGNVSRSEDVERLLTFIGNVRGVKVIRNLLTVSSEASRRDRGVLERLHTALTEIYPDYRLRLACFGHVAVVGGQVPRLSIKRDIEDILAHQSGIARVVNKIEVTAS